MNAHKLAHILLAGPDYRVFQGVYEGGLEDVASVSEPVLVALDVKQKKYHGDHDYADHPESANREAVDAATKVLGLVIR